MRFPQRTKSTYWSTDSPITDIHEALDLLAHTPTTIEPVFMREGDAGWEVVHPFHREGCSGRDTSGEEYFELDRKLAERLVQERLVIPYTELGWGWSRPNPNMLIISEKGLELRSAFLENMRAKAESMLPQAVRHGISRVVSRGRWGREGYHTGALYFEFRAPNNDICRVYPESERIAFPNPPPTSPE